MLPMKRRATSGGGRFGQQLSSPANGGQRALQLVGQAVYIGFDIGLPIELTAHGFEGATESLQLRAVESRQSGWLVVTDRIGVVHQLADGAVEPPCQQGTDQQRDEQQHGCRLQ